MCVRVCVSAVRLHTITFESLTHQTKQHLAAKITECGRLIGVHVQAMRLQCWHFRCRIQYGCWGHQMDMVDDTFVKWLSLLSLAKHRLKVTAHAFYIQYLRLAVNTISTNVSSTTSAAELIMCSTLGVL